MKVAPNDPPVRRPSVHSKLLQGPIRQAEQAFCCRLRGNGNVGDHDENNDVSDWDNRDDSLNRKDDDVMDEDTEINTEESVPRILRDSVQDFGSGIPLPFFERISLIMIILLPTSHCII